MIGWFKSSVKKFLDRIDQDSQINYIVISALIILSVIVGYFAGDVLIPVN